MPQTLPALCIPVAVLSIHMILYNAQHDEDETVAAMVAEPDPELLKEIADGPLALGDHDLRSMKDELLIQTAEMLGVNLLTAEVLLRQYGRCVCVCVCARSLLPEECFKLIRLVAWQLHMYLMALEL